MSRMFKDALLASAIAKATPHAINARMNATERNAPALMSAPGLPAPSSMPGISYISSGIPSYSDLAAYNVNRDGWEAIRQSLFDFNSYTAAGVPQLSFFQQPVGQGSGRNLTAGVLPKTQSDTNLVSQGQMPANQEFLIQSVEVVFFPNITTPSATPYVAADLPSNVAATGAVQNSINDTWKFYNSGNLTLTIGSKAYVQDGPLLRFPPKAFFELHGAVATTGAGNASTITFATARGRPYMLQPANLRLVSNQNFIGTLNWPEGNQAIVNPARVQMILDGILYRRSQ